MQMFDIQFLDWKLNCCSICTIAGSWVAATLCLSGISSSFQTYKHSSESRYAQDLFDCKASKA